MKKFFSIIVCVVLLAVCTALVAPNVAQVSKVSAATPEEIKINANQARFLNMLNHNFVYNSDFDNANDIVNNSVLALLDLRDSTNEDFISETYVKGFVKDMYGVEVEDMSSLNAGYPQIDGFLYIIPRGYTSYDHTITSVQENEDGSFTVKSDVTVIDHDGEAEVHQAESLFVVNAESAFGYNMIYCNIIV